MTSLKEPIIEVVDNVWKSAHQQQPTVSASPPKDATQPLTPPENNDPTLPKQQSDDADSTSTLSPAPSPLLATSSKTSSDDQPQSESALNKEGVEEGKVVEEGGKPEEATLPLLSGDKAQPVPSAADAEPKLQAPTEVPKTTPEISSKEPTPDERVGIVLEINAELLR